MSKYIFLILIFISISSCSSLKKALGVDKDVPDEFLIKKIEPIEKPPNFDLLPPGNKVKSQKKSNIEAKKIIDQNLKKNSNEEKDNSSTDISTTLEIDILNKINKK